MWCPTDLDGGGCGMDKLDENPEIALDMLKSIHEYNKSPWGITNGTGRCEYHDHSDGSKCV